MKNEVDINNNILIWAVERAGFNVDYIAEKIPNFTAWLSGDKKPTIKQLEKFSQKVHVPFGYLFLKTIPAETIPIPYFKRNDNNKVSLNVYDTVLILQQRMQWLHEYLQNLDEPALPYVGSMTQNRNINEVVQSIRTTLGLEKTWAKEFTSWEEALKNLTLRVEDAGINIVFNSVVGNNTHRTINVDECRGFVLTDEYAPFMFINSADSKAAQMFTILHELAHIWIGRSAGFDLRELSAADDPVEKFCDKIAAEFLVPEEELKTQWENKNIEIKKLAHYFKVSQLVIARRLMDLAYISKDGFISFYSGYLKRIKERKESKKSSGGDFYKTQNRRIGTQFANFVRNAIKGNSILYRDAWQLTGLNGKTFDKFINQL